MLFPDDHVLFSDKLFHDDYVFVPNYCTYRPIQHIGLLHDIIIKPKFNACKPTIHIHAIYF